jgi:16S rRNA (cytosine967-C5)-methyltransferase
MQAIPADLTSTNPREIALAVLYHFRDRDTNASQLLHELLRRGAVRGADARLATEIAMGVLRQRNRLDGILEKRTRQPWHKTPPLVRDILRIGAYQLLFMTRMPAHAAVNETVELARLWATPGQAALVNAILRRVAEEGAAAIALPSPPPRAEWPRFYSHPAWLVQYLLANYPADQVVALMEWDNRPPLTMLRANRLRLTAEALAERLRTNGYEVGRVGWPTPAAVELTGQIGDVGSAFWYTEGLATVQDGAAQLVAFLVDPKPGERVVDWSAAPGGKSTHLAELSGDQATILALDVDPGRLAHVAVQAERLGLNSVRTYLHRPDLIDWLAQNPADAILVDAPCTGLGTIQRHPDIRWRRKDRDLERSAQLQLEILEAAARCLRKAGRLIYSTCTLGPVENEQVVGRFLERNHEFDRDTGLAGVSPIVRPFLDSEGHLRTWPPEHALDAFFAARLIRR